VLYLGFCKALLLRPRGLCHDHGLRLVHENDRATWRLIDWAAASLAGTENLVHTRHFRSCRRLLTRPDESTLKQKHAMPFHFSRVREHVVNRGCGQLAPQRSGPWFKGD
jgi:hypothetical protein